MSAAIDFASNDYLGLAHCPRQQALVQQQITIMQQQSSSSPLGATGSRLLSGDSLYVHQLEDELGRYHGTTQALICNSGYDANLSVLSSLPCRQILYDDAIHNSVHMGLRLWQSYNTNSNHNKKWIQSFRHNSVTDLERQLQSMSSSSSSQVVIVVESVYSMDGDIAPVADMLQVAQRYQAQVVVDEAHGLGVLGERRLGLLEQEKLMNHPALLCAVYTFGKAAGCHGAVVVSNTKGYKDYLVNFAYPLIYSTALPTHSLVTIACAYQTLVSERGRQLQQDLHALVHYFRELMHNVILTPTTTTKHRQHHDDDHIRLLESTTPIQALIIPGNEACTRICQYLQQQQEQLVVFPIKSPTVPAGSERIRIVLHATHTRKQVRQLVTALAEALHQHYQQTTTKSKL